MNIQLCKNAIKDLTLLGESIVAVKRGLIGKTIENGFDLVAVPEGRADWRNFSAGKVWTLRFRRCGTPL